MKATIPTRAPILVALLALAVLWSAPAWAAAPRGHTEGSPPAKQTVSEDDIKQLAARYYGEGLDAEQAGRLRLARARFKAALRLDPKHLKAKAALAAVEARLGITDEDRLKEKMTTRIPEVSFTDAPLRDVVEYVAHEADVNIVFNAAAIEALAAQQDAPGPGELGPVFEDEPEELPGVGPEEATPPAARRTDLITIHLKNVPLKEVLKYVLRYKGLRYIVEEYAVLIVPIGWVPPDEMETEIFRLTTGTLGARRIESALGEHSGFRTEGGY